MGVSRKPAKNEPCSFFARAPEFLLKLVILFIKEVISMQETTKNEHSKSTIVNMRVPVNLKERWQQAAVMRGVTLTDFMIMSVNGKASETFYEEEKIKLSQRDREMLTELLEGPPQFNKGMQEAVSAWLKHRNERELRGL
jgi:uncharacterized protein (DUF1778 family)